MAALFLVVMVGKLREPEIKTNEELIPAKYAKLILVKPKENKSTPVRREALLSLKPDQSGGSRFSIQDGSKKHQAVS